MEFTLLSRYCRMTTLIAIANPTPFSDKRVLIFPNFKKDLLFTFTKELEYCRLEGRRDNTASEVGLRSFQSGLNVVSRAIVGMTQQDA